MKMHIKWLYFLLIIFIFPACKTNINQQYDLVRINPDKEHQYIDGFGTSIVNYKKFPPEYFDENFIDQVVYDLGLSILRIPINEQLEFTNDDNDPDHFNWDGFYLSNNNRIRGMTETMDFVQKFKKRGVNLFMASPWSPPQFMKTNRAPIQGGFLRTDMYDEFAEYLAAFIILAKQNWDIDIHWISLQNESIFVEFYRSCLYHGYGMKEALKAVMEKFEKEKINSRIIINEDVLFPERVQAFLQPVFSDSITAKFNGDIAVHRYAEGKDLVKWVDLTKDFNRRYLMTETSGHDTTWAGAMDLARDIHEYLVLGNFSAWIYWQISGNTGGSNPGLYTLMLEGKPTKKYYTSKHFYRYIRPGAIRIDASESSDSLLISAYKHPEEGNLTVIMINPSDNDYKVRLEPAKSIPRKFDVHKSTEKELFVDKSKYRAGDLLQIPANSVVSLYGHRESLKEPKKVISYKEALTGNDTNNVMLGNSAPFPIRSEWQGASDAHVGWIMEAESAINSGEINKQRYDGWSLLHESILNGDGDAVKYLIANGADINIPAADGWTPLHAAASCFVGNHDIQIKNKEYHQYEIFRMLLDAGADINAVTKDGWTPLHCAVINANTGWMESEDPSLNRIKDLLQAGADLEAKDINGRTPLHWAAMQGYSHFIDEKTEVESDVVELLISKGANVNAIDLFGRSPLHYAVQMGYESITYELARSNANVLLADAQKKTPVDLARENNSESILYILENKKMPVINITVTVPKNKQNSATDQDMDLANASVSGNAEK